MMYSRVVSLFSINVREAVNAPRDIHNEEIPYHRHLEGHVEAFVPQVAGDHCGYEKGEDEYVIQIISARRVHENEEAKRKFKLFNVLVENLNEFVVLDVAHVHEILLLPEDVVFLYHEPPDVGEEESSLRVVRVA